MTDVKGKFFTEKVGEVLDYQVKWNAELGEDTIITSSWVVPTGLTQPTSPPAFHDDKTATIWLRADSAGEFECINTIASAGGRTFIGILRLKVSIPSPIATLPVYTVGQLAALQAAYAQGVQRVRYSDKEVEYRSRADMAALIAEMEDQITGAATNGQKQSRFSLASFYKGH